MKEKQQLTREQWAGFIIRHHPIAFIENFMPDPPENPGAWEPGGGCVKARFYEHGTVSWDFLAGEQRDVSWLKRLGDRADIGGRTRSKSFHILTDELEDTITRHGLDSLITALDKIHVSDRMNDVSKYMHDHKFFRLFLGNKRESPRWEIRARNGHMTYGVIEGLSGKGNNYLGLHVHRLKIDEMQLITNRGFKQLADAKAETGRVEIKVLVPDGMRTTPAHDVIVDKAYARNRMILSSHVSPFWDTEKEKDAVKKYKGKNNPDYVHNVEAKEGEVTQGVWDIADVSTCTEEGRPPIIIFIGKEDVARCPKKGEIATLLPLPPLPREHGEVILGIDTGFENDPTVIIPYVRQRGRKSRSVGDGALEKWREVCKIKLLRVLYDKQAEIIDYVMTALNANYAGVDTTGADGRAIVQKLQNEETYPGRNYVERIVPVCSTAKVLVGYALDERGNVKKDNKGKPIELFEIVKVKATSEAQLMLAEKGLALPDDPEATAEFAAERSHESQRGGRVYLTSYTDHILAALRCFSLVKFLKFEAKQITLETQKFDIQKYLEVGGWMEPLNAGRPEMIGVGS